MSFTLVFNSEVHTDYRDAYDWYEAQKKGLGDEFEAAIDAELNAILTNPKAYHFAKGRYREAALTKFPFTIVYKINTRKNTIYISAIHHTSRNPTHKFR